MAYRKGVPCSGSHNDQWKILQCRYIIVDNLKHEIVVWTCN